MCQWCCCTAFSNQCVLVSSMCGRGLGAVFFASTVSLLVLTAHALLRKCLSGWYTRWSQWLAVGECKVEMYVK